MIGRTFAWIAGVGLLIAIGTSISSSSAQKPVRVVMLDRVSAEASPDPNLRPELYVVAQIDSKFASNWKVERLFVYDDDTGEQIQTVFEVPSTANDFCKDGPRYTIPFADPAKRYRLEYVLWPTREYSQDQSAKPSETGWKPFNVHAWTEYVQKAPARDFGSVANAAKPARS